MDALQFAYWLQGFSELGSEPPTAEQWQSIKEHLATVFNKVTPPLVSPGGRPFRPFDLTGAPSIMPLRAECAQTPNGQAAVALC